jgi:hypothetical protein
MNTAGAFGRLVLTDACGATLRLATAYPMATIMAKADAARELPGLVLLPLSGSRA